MLNCIDISYPQVNDYMSLNSTTMAIGASSSISGIVSGYHNLAAQYNGITFLTGSGTMTGEVSIYGYNA
jgi:hypothetical protein